MEKVVQACAINVPWVHSRRRERERREESTEEGIEEEGGLT